MDSAPHGSVIWRVTPRPDLVAFDVKARITRPDIDWMASAVEQAMEAHDKIDMLLIFSNFEGMDPASIFDWHASSVMARSIVHIRRYVVVGAPGLAEALIKFSGMFMPLETRTFDPADEPAAWTFLAAGSSERVPLGCRLDSAG